MRLRLLMLLINLALLAAWIGQARPGWSWSDGH